LLLHCLVLILFLVPLTLSASAQGQLSPEIREKIDKLATEVLTRTGVPSASVAIVKDSQIVYVKAYGDARLEPRTPATPKMRYSIGSISKQFTATAILLLQEQGKLSLDDKVAKFLPTLTRAKEVTIRQLLSHTSGYQDYWPQDYVMPMMLQPVTAEKIMDLWARKPLDFEPGTKWQYSNTNYVIAGVIIEKVSGKLNGRSGTFLLQHSGTMTRGTPHLIVTVVPDSGTGELAGLEGTFLIKIDDGKHSYEFAYTLTQDKKE